MTNWNTDSDWDVAQRDPGVHHEQPAFTDWALDDDIEKGYPSVDEDGSSLGAYWPMDEDAGQTVAHDVSANANDGATQGGVTWGDPGILGTSSITLDGVDDKVVVPHDASIGPASTLTVTGWFKASTGAVPDTNWGQMVNKTSSTNPFEYGLAWADEDTKVLARVRESSTRSVTVRSQETWGPDDGWTMWGFTFDGSRCSLYKNGRLDHTVPFSGTLQQSGLELGIGGNPVSTNQIWFDGSISDLRIYNRALDVRQMEALHRVAM